MIATASANPFLAAADADVPDLHVPKVLIRVFPAASQERPNLEKTTRDDYEAEYAVPVAKVRWGIKATKIDVFPIGPEAVKAGHSPVQAVKLNPHLGNHCESEAHRLKKKYGEKNFYMVYPGDTFRTVFEKAVQQSQPSRKDSK